MRKFTFRNLSKTLWVFLLLLISSGSYAQYCIPSSDNGCSDGDDINSFILSGANGTSINDLNTGCSSGDYADTTVVSINLSQGVPYYANISSEYYDNGDGDYCAIWIDFNDDLVFQSTEMVGFRDAALLLNGSNVTLEIPLSAPLGTHRMRVTAYYPYDAIFGDPMTSAEVDPCNVGSYVYGYGETQDYKVNITPAPPCLPPSALTSNPGSGEATVSWNGTGTFIMEYGPQGYTPGTGTTAGTGGTLVTNPASPHTISGLDGLTTYDIYVRRDCSGTFSGNSFTSVTTPPSNATNLNCSTALSLTPGATCVTTSASTVGAGVSTVPDCADENNGEVWFSFVATQSDHVITLSNVSSLQNNPYFAWGVELNSGTCGNLTPMGCSQGSDFFGVTPAELYIGGLSIGTTYYVRVWDDFQFDGNFDNAVGDITFDICVSVPTSAPTDCAFLETPGDAENAGIYPSLSWDPVEFATAYNIYLDQNTTPTTLYATTSQTSYIPTTALTPGTYYWYVTPMNSLGSATGCDANTQSFTVVGPPANDNASNAIELIVGAPCSGNSFTNENANHNPGEPYASCNNQSTGQHSVWYKFVAPASGSVRISTDIGTTPGTLDDTKLGLFSASDVNNYATFNILACDDDNGAISSNVTSIIFVTDLTGGQTYYVQVDGYSATDYGTFCLEIAEINPTMLSSTASCADLQTPGGSSSFTGWVTLVDEDGFLVANVRNQAGGAVSDYTGSYNVDGNGFGTPRQDVNGRYYLSRNYMISNPDITTPVDVRFYFHPGEIATLAGVTSNETNLTNLNVTKQEGSTCNANFADANGPTTILMQNLNGVVNGVSWIQVSTSSFSNFYLMGGLTPLSISLSKISAENMGRYNLVKWTTATEDAGDYFELERGNDGRNFSFLSKITTNQKPSDYSFNDNNPLENENFYRLKLVSKDGKFTYSKVVSAIVKGAGGFSVKAYPNPVKNNVQVKVSGSENGDVTLSDIAGRVVYQSKVTGSEINIDLTKLSEGVYFIKYTDNNLTKTIKISKQ